MRKVTISKVMNGYIVQVGCQTLVFASSETLLAELAIYLADPILIERAYIERYGGITNDVPPTPTTQTDYRFSTAGLGLQGGQASTGLILPSNQYVPSQDR